jgi:hypothetical protein
MNSFAGRHRCCITPIGHAAGARLAEKCLIAGTAQSRCTHER